MPSVADNRRMFSQTWRWSEAGDEWSARWGGTERFWQEAILPRIQAFVPAGVILEIAPGFGRWTRYLKDLCRRLVLVDLSERCIRECRERFAGETHIDYHVNDGYSLDMVADRSVDFVFSFDSLVHAEADVLQAYLRQLARKLKPDGAGFLHHSNLGAYRRSWRLVSAMPSARLQHWLGGAGLFVDLRHWRAPSMTAELFDEYCRQAGLQCIGQETVNWAGGRYLIDCFSLLTHPGSVWARPNRVCPNRSFRQEAGRISKFSRLYPSRGCG